MLVQLRNLRFYVILSADLVIFLVALVGAYLLRFDFTLPAFCRTQILQVVPWLVPGQALIFLFLGLYRGLWRFCSLNDLRRLAQACFCSMLFHMGLTFYVFGLPGVPRSVFFLDACLTLLLSGGLRLSIRLFYAFIYRCNGTWPFSLARRRNLKPAEKSVLIVGAGRAGEKMLREIFDNPHLHHHVIGFLDDDQAKWGRSVHGVKVYGGVEKLPKIIKGRKIDEVLIAIPGATGPQMRRIIELCKRCRVHHRTLPEIGAIIDGKVSIKGLRDVKYEDLLRRPPVRLEAKEIHQYLSGKRVLITGAGGSIGSELCRQIIRFDPRELILVDGSEEHLFNLQMELHHELNFRRYHCVLSRVQNQPLMDEVFRNYLPQLIFHAAAYKHVPMLEINPWQAIFNNVLGSQVVMELALKYAVERFVLVSTDKAVRPTNVMGASKRLAELLLQSFKGNGVRFMAVRFGNVIGSSGSVLPLFRRQLEQGGPITVTHPEATRYFMTIPEAAQLILQAGGLGRGGEIYLLEMGIPVKIAQMAEELVRLSGKQPGEDVEIIFTGLREGEKLYEELITQGEDVVATSHEKILVLRANGWNGRKSQAEFCRWLEGSLEELYEIAHTHEAQAIKGKLREMLPEYQPQRHVKSVLESESSRRPGEVPRVFPASPGLRTAEVA